jgi:hypothetical protein
MIMEKTILNSNNQIIAYESFSGNVYQLSFFGDEWWVTTPDEKLQHATGLFGMADIEFLFVCNAGGKVDAITLAKILGKALENSFSPIDSALALRVAQLKRLGITEGWQGEQLDFEWELFSNDKGSKRQGKYSIRCQRVGSSLSLFDIDAFDVKADAEHWVKTYFKFLRSQGITVNTKEVKSKELRVKKELI